MKNLKVLCAGLLFTFLFSFSAQAQHNNYEKGTILVNEKKTIDAYIQIDFRFPQRFQSSITYISPEAYEKFQQSGKLKGKAQEKLKPKDIIGFDLEEGKSFRTVKYTDLNSTTKLGMIPKKMCLEKVVDGKIDLYKMYSHTTGKISYEIIGAINASKDENDDSIIIDYIQDNFQLLVQKDSDNPKNLMSVSLLNYFGDNEAVKENYTQNHYGFRDEFTEKKGVIVGKKLESAFLRLLQDYDSSAAGQLSK